MKRLIFILFICLLVCSCKNNSNNITSKLENNYSDLEFILNKKILSIDTLIYYSNITYRMCDDDTEDIDYDDSENIDINNIIYQSEELQIDYYIDMSKLNPIIILVVHTENNIIYINNDDHRIYEYSEIINSNSFVSKKHFDAIYKVLESNLILKK